MHYEEDRDSVCMEGRKDCRYVGVSVLVFVSCC